MGRRGVWSFAGELFLGWKGRRFRHSVWLTDDVGPPTFLPDAEDQRRSLLACDELSGEVGRFDQQCIGSVEPRQQLNHQLWCG